MDITAIFPGTFDPVTYGHVSLIKRSKRLFHRIIVAVAESQSKSPVIAFADRISLVREAILDIAGVEVVGFSDLLVDCAQRLRAHSVIRGLRAVADFKYEFQLAAMNRRLDPSLEAIFLAPEETYAFLSSSLIKETHRMGGDVSPWVPPAVLAFLPR